MRSTIFALCVIVLLCSFAAHSQTVFEPESTVRIEEKTAFVFLSVRAESDSGSIPALVELIDSDSTVKGQSLTRTVAIRTGVQTLEFRIPIGEIELSTSEDIAWYRLRYKIGNSSGIISMSEMLADLFELRVIASSNLLAGMTYRVRMRAINPFTGRPAGGVSISTVVDLDLLGDGDQVLKLSGSAETDGDGFAVIDLLIPTETKLDGDGVIRVTGRKNGMVREAKQDLMALKDDVQFLLMTDKPIYQPEQMLNVRGILMKGGEGKVALADSEVEFRISDEDDTVLYREKVRSSAFGIAAIGWRIPANAKLGDYRLEVRDDTGEQIGGHRVKVSRYDLPNFVVEAKARKPYYLPGENEAVVEIRANYLFGKPVTEGKVRVVEETSRQWNWTQQKYDIDEGQVREGETDASGTFIAILDLKGAHKDLEGDDWQKHRDIHFAACFTDPTTNKTEQRRFDVRVTREPIHVYFIGETSGLDPALPIKGYVSTFYADGTPAECEIEIQASEEDKNKFKTALRLSTNALGAGKIAIPRPRIGDRDDDLDLRIVARDRNGRRGTVTSDLGFDVDSETLQISTDKAIYKPGDTMTVSIASAIKSGPVYIDVVNGWSVVDSRFVVLKNGKATLRIPYSDTFKGELKVAAFVEEDDEEIIHASRGVIYPSRQGISVDASFDRAMYKPNEEATVRFGVVDAVGKAIESVLGIVVVDRAVEERARTDADFGGMWGGFAGWLGYGGQFGTINIKDLNELDLSRPISDEMQLVAEIILHDNYYKPDLFRSNSYYKEAGSVFATSVNKQFEPVAAALKNAFEKSDHLHPVDDASLRSILATYNIDLDKMPDPWGVAYKARFSVDKSRNIVTITSAGPDKQFETRDDFTAFATGFEYFTLMGKTIDTVVKNYHARTGDFIRDENALFQALGISQITDRFGRPYKIVFEGDGRFLKIRLRSAGADGKFEIYDWSGDDFYVWNSQIDYFAATEMKISDAQRSVKPIPMNEAGFRASLTAAGINVASLRDGNGNPLYIVAAQSSRNWDRVTIENVQNYGDSRVTERRTITPVSQKIIEFSIRSNGRDGIRGTYDDFTLTQVTHVLSEQTRDDPNPAPIVRPASFSMATGSITGTVTDPNGAVIAGAAVAATNTATNVSRSVTTNDSGSYLISGLDAGTYLVRVSAMAFKDTVIQGIAVKANATIRANVSLEVGSVSETVSVSSGSENVMSTSSSAVSTTVTSQQITSVPLAARNSLDLMKLRPSTAATQNSTPRLREYFPETLVWQPEVLTDKNGKTEVRFRMADTITTWKMYAIASTKNGRIGVTGKEVAAFQPFFVDLDPPKFLTAGDEIHLPSQLRNYTEKKQRVYVTMAQADWFSILGADKQQIDVEAGNSRNAIFGFKAVRPIKDGKQRVTAIAQSESDAMEKPVTVRPNGQEIVATESRVTTGNAAFDINFPANALPLTQKAELKIYPNLFSHVSESVDGLLQRPYGCGEQTISSTYPNLMILKFVKADSPLAKKAKRLLQAGYERLLGYQIADGGFTYWGGKDKADVALTAYALRFLNDARSQITVDDRVIKNAEDWLVRQQRSDGSWSANQYYETTENAKRTKLTTTYVTRSLAMRSGADTAVLKKALNYLRTRNAEIDEPYTLALIGLASLDSGDSKLANEIAQKLEAMAVDESGSTYWNLETNTPFNGWGTTGRIETTALVLQLLIRDLAAFGDDNSQRKELIEKGTLFLLKNKDRYGVWHSTQTTINVLDAFLAAIGDREKAKDQTIQLVVNGTVIQNVAIPSDKIDPAIVDLTGKLGTGANRVEVRRQDGPALMSQVVMSHYIDWRDSDTANRTVNRSRALRLDYKCDKTSVAIMEEVTCSVEAERIGSQGYGMLLAEIGTPPGADVSRESLEKAVESDWSISRYDVLPDRIVVYMWSKAGGTKFNFKFKPRYGINAQTPSSIVYDYYNPEARALVSPLRFLAK